MRAVLLLPLSVVMAGITGCGHQGREEVAVAATERDLTLPARAPELETASAIELQQPLAKPQAARRSSGSSRPAQASRVKSGRARAVAAAPVTAAVAKPSQPTPDTHVPSDRELLPGKTITVIPASSGPTTAAEPVDELPMPKARRGFIGIRGGGKCPPRPARGIGIVGVPAARLY